MWMFACCTSRLDAVVPSRNNKGTTTSSSFEDTTTSTTYQHEARRRDNKNTTTSKVPSKRLVPTVTPIVHNNNKKQHDDFGTKLMTACWLGKMDIDAFLQQYHNDDNDETQLATLMRRHFPKSCQVLPLSQIRFLRLRMGPWLFQNEEYYHVYNDNKDCHNHNTAADYEKPYPWTPMHYACARFDVDVMQYMLYRGGSLTAAAHRTMPLHWLGRNFRRHYPDALLDNELALLRAVEWVVDHVDAAAWMQPDDQGISALERVVECASFTAVQVLLVRLVCGVQQRQKQPERRLQTQTTVQGGCGSKEE